MAQFLLDDRALHELAKELRAERRVVECGIKRRRDDILSAGYLFRKRAAESDNLRFTGGVIGSQDTLVNARIQQPFPRVAKRRVHPAFRVERSHPCRQRIAIITRGDHRAVFIPIRGVGFLPAQ
jgi:hypothetical protein